MGEFSEFEILRAERELERELELLEEDYGPFDQEAVEEEALRIVDGGGPLSLLESKPLMRLAHLYVQERGV